MRLFTLKRQIYGKDLDKTVKEYYLAESDREFIERCAPWVSPLDLPQSDWYENTKEYQKAHQEYEEELKATMEARCRKEIDHEFWMEDVSWESEEVTEEEIRILRKFRIIKFRIIE